MLILREFPGQVETLLASSNTVIEHERVIVALSVAVMDVSHVLAVICLPKILVLLTGVIVSAHDLRFLQHRSQLNLIVGTYLLKVDKGFDAT